MHIITKSRLKKDVGFMLLELRTSLGLTQEEFAIKVGKNREAVARWESGKHFVSMATMCEIAKALNTQVVPPTFLLIPRPVAYGKYHL